MPAVVTTFRWLPAIACALFAATALAVEPPDFDREIAPLLASRCLECHSGDDAKGGLDLGQRARAFAGGDSGVVIETGNTDSSLLWQRVAADEMPPKHPLPESEKQLLRRWIEAGAPWGTDPIDPFRYTTSTRAGTDWWSLQPLENVHPPDAELTGLDHNPIDCFIAARLADSGLAPSPRADRRTLIRRLSLDLTGLPPSPTDVESFLDGTNPDAYEQYVDQLLASPHYGERWARHWLDVVRYGETDGFERNARRNNSWRYRDWVTSALNSDLPYDEFCRLQLCGDTNIQARPGDVIATGYLVAGVHNTVLGNDQMRAVARQDELEDLIGNVSQSFLGLTANCARCHDHKFDPISQVDYYRLSAALAGVQHGEREVAIPHLLQQLGVVTARIAGLQQQRRAQFQAAWSRLLADESLPTPSPGDPLQPIAAWDFATGGEDRIGAADFSPVEPVEFGSEGVHIHDGGYLKSAPLGRALTEKTLEAWIRLDALDQQGGGVISVQSSKGNVFDAIVYGEREPGRWMAGSDSFNRTRPFGGPEETEATTQFVHIAIVYAADRTITCYRNGEPYGTSYQPPGHARLDAESIVLIGCRHEPPGGNRMLSGAVSKARLYDTALSPDQVRASALSGGLIASPEQLLARLTDDEREIVAKLDDELRPLEDTRAQLQAEAKFQTYAVRSEQPADTRLLRRGDLALAGEVLSPGAIAAFGLAAADFTDDPGLPEAQRRQKLAEWITTTAEPLFARVIVNRLWHHHFGVGLVETPSDFGFNGGRPSHPELLDWLANELLRRDFRLKDIQRLIVTSATYRQSSLPRADALALDADSRLLWRKRPLRLDAEQMRDSLLAAAGLLNGQLGGAPFSDYRIIDTMNGTVYYEPDDPIGAEFHRRSVYRFTPRGANQGLLDTFDCPDPAASAPRRNTTTTPLQALSLWNGSFALRMAEQIAANAAAADSHSRERQIIFTYEAILQREPTDIEHVDARALVSAHGLRSLCRALINSNEFLTVP